MNTIFGNANKKLLIGIIIFIIAITGIILIGFTGLPGSGVSDNQIVPQTPTQTLYPTITQTPTQVVNQTIPMAINKTANQTTSVTPTHIVNQTFPLATTRAIAIQDVSNKSMH